MEWEALCDNNNIIKLLGTSSKYTDTHTHIYIYCSRNWCLFLFYRISMKISKIFRENVIINLFIGENLIYINVEKA